MSQTYLTTDELSVRIKYAARTIRERLKDSVCRRATKIDHLNGVMRVQN